MTPAILTGPAGSGKTSTIIDAILTTEQSAFWSEVWVLLPTRLQSEAFREKLTERVAGQMPLFNVSFFEFYELYDMLLDLAGSPQRTIRRASGDRILREVIRDVYDDLHYYSQIAAKPGFIALVSEFIRELKQGLVKPETFEDYARDTGNAKDHDLALIYRTYQDFLAENNLVDRDGAGWVALEEVRATHDLVTHVALLAVDGFDNFTPLQAMLLAALAGQIEDTRITLTYDDRRDPTAMRTFKHTLERLQSVYPEWQVSGHDPSHELPRSEALAHLEQQLFALSPAPHPAGDSLHLLEAPDPREEVRMVLREIKKMLLDGIAPEDIAVVMRDVDTYADLLRHTAAAFGVPVQVRQSERVMNNPAVRTVLQLLDVHRLDFPRRQLLDVLYSPYITPLDFSTEDIAALDRISMQKTIVRGRETWLRGLERDTKRMDDDEDEIIEVGAQPDLSQRLEYLFERITPPAEASARDYVSWIESLLGIDPEADAVDSAELPEEMETSPSVLDDFGLYRHVRGGASAGVEARDLYALHGFRAALAEVLTAYELLADIHNSHEPVITSWDSFRADLELAIKERAISDQANRSRSGRVLVTTVFEARGLPHEHVFIVGLSEGIFPARQNEDPLYSDREREKLADHAINVTRAAERIRDPGLFYEMCALAGSTLTLSRPTIDEGGNPWEASVFWKSACEVLQNASLIRRAPGSAPTLEEAATRRELTVSLCSALNQPESEISAAAWAAVGWIESQPVWANLRRGRSIELDRESARTPFNRFSGILQHPALLAEAAAMLDENRLWSASQFNDLGQCAFRFFSKRLLSLEEYEEPEEGLDVMQLGSVNHKILEETYRRLAEANVTIEPDNMAYGLDVLRECAERVFATAPRDFGFRQTRFWEEEQKNILRRLERLVRKDFSPDSPVSKFIGKDVMRKPFRVEAGFGYDGAPFLSIDGAAGRLQARGYIDRMDITGDNEVIILDYKSGAATPKNSDLAEGRNFQMLLYLLAAARILAESDEAYRIHGGLFWSIQRNKSDGELPADDALIQSAQAALHQSVIAARRGWFPNQPRKLENGRCYHHCEFSQFCRVNRASRYKPQITG